MRGSGRDEGSRWGPAAVQIRALLPLEGRSALFDKAYMQAMAEDHATDLQKVTTFEQQATDKSFKKLLTSARKEIASHKKDADKLVQKLGSTAAR